MPLGFALRCAVALLPCASSRSGRSCITSSVCEAVRLCVRGAPMGAGWRTFRRGEAVVWLREVRSMSGRGVVDCGGLAEGIGGEPPVDEFLLTGRDFGGIDRAPSG